MTNTENLENKIESAVENILVMESVPASEVVAAKEEEMEPEKETVVPEKAKKFFKKIGRVAVLVSMIFCLVLGYAVGRGYKTYEINIKEKNVGKVVQTKPTGEKYIDLGKELVSPTRYAPKLTVATIKGATGGYDLKISTTAFVFSNFLSNDTVVQNAGFANVFVNDVFVGRSFAEYFHIDEKYLTDGKNIVSVTLSANNGKTWWSKVGTLEARANIEIVK